MQIMLLNIKWPEVDMTVTVSVIVTLCALASPIITAVINNWHNTKIRRLELQEKHYEEIFLHKREVFEEYIQALEVAMVSYDVTVQRHYGHCYSRAALLIPENIASAMNELDNSIKMACNGEFVNTGYSTPPYKADPTMRSQFTQIRRMLQTELQAEYVRCTQGRRK